MQKGELDELRRRVEKLEERALWLEAKMKFWEQEIKEGMKKWPRRK